jgi:putative ABC transport system permease protein
MLKLSLRDLRMHKARYILTFVAVAIGVTFMGGILTVTDTISRTFHDLISDVNEGTDAWVQGTQQFEAEFTGIADRPRIDDSLAGPIDELDVVAASEGYVQGFTRILDSEGEPYGEVNFGPPSFGSSWTGSDELNPWTLGDGSRPPTGPDEIVLDKATAEGAGHEIGDTVSFQTTHGAGEAELVGVARFGTADSPMGAGFVLFEPSRAQELLSEPGMVDGIGIVGRPGSDQAEVRDAVAELLDAQLDPAERDDVEVVTGEMLTADTQAEADEQFGFIRNILLVFAALSVTVGSFVIYTSFSFIVAQRQRQTALLRAVGATRAQTLWSVLLESLVVGLLASVTGYVIGIGLALVMSNVFVDNPASLVLKPSSVALALGVGIVVTAASAFIPAWRASRVAPVAALRNVAIDTADRSVGRMILGAAVLVGGVVAMVWGLDEGGVEIVGLGIFLVFLGLVVVGPLAARPATIVLGRPLPAVRGVVGRVAQRNAERNPKRTAYTGSALMIGLGVVSLILVMNSSISRSIDDMVDNRFIGDFVVDAGTGWSGAGMPGEVAVELNQLDEVEAATGVRFGQVEVEGSRQFVGGLDPATGFDLFDVGIVDGDLDRLDGTGIGIFEEEAAEKGYEVGDEVSVTFAETGEQVFEVAVLMETQDLTGTYMFANEVFDTHLPDAGDAQIWIQLASGVDTGDAKPVLEDTVTGAPTAELLDLDEFKEMTKSQFEPILVMLGVLLALTIVVAMVGIVNTLVLSIVERTQEIGLTRAVGGTRAQIRAAIRWEALLIAAFGLMAAIGIGVFFGWVIVQALEEEGFRAFDVPVVALATVTAVTGVLTLMAALLPAWWGARRPILPAIATD